MLANQTDRPANLLYQYLIMHRNSRYTESKQINFVISTMDGLVRHSIVLKIRGDPTGCQQRFCSNGNGSNA